MKKAVRLKGVTAEMHNPPQALIGFGPELQQSMGVKITRASKKKIHAELTVAPLVLNRNNRANGGALMAFADCVVKRDPTTAKRTILALPTSLQENTQFTALLPSLGPCLYKGQKITFSKSILTGALGEVLYRNSEIPDVRAAAGAR